MSAHVIAKPQPFSAEDDEKTTIESAWEEEASTTVEQGEVADKIRALGIEPKQPSEGNTSTSGAPLEELTVDEQRGGNAQFSLMTPPIVAPARIIVTQGNDSGQELEVRPGKTYSIGRGIDNDFVLTDITVSRKHFELRFESDAWILADRGSGNGTLVNGNIEDHPFMLANGDTIEIGNTLFRFDFAAGSTRSAAASYSVDLDEEEPSTVAGKPLRSDLPIPQTPQPLPPPIISRTTTRPKTQPPPPPRPRVSTMQPVYSPAPQMQPIVAAPMPPATTLPMPQMTPRSPLASPSAPTMLGDPIMHSPGMPPPMMPTTLPGGHVAPPPPSHVLPFTYPVIGSADRASQPPHAQMLVIAAAHAQGRDATSTALVPPVPYHNGMMPGTPQSFTAQPRQTAPISRRTKLVLGGAALTMIAAVTTVIIIKTVGSNSTTPTAKTETEKTTPEKATPPTKEQQFSIKPIDTKESAKGTDDATAKKLADDAKKKDEEAKKKAEDDKKKAIADAKAVEEAKKKAEDDQKRKAAEEEQKRKADEKRLADEARKKADEEKQRKLADQRQQDLKASEQRKQDLAARREAELQKLEERKKAQAEERKQKDEERKQAIAEERKRQAEERKKQDEERKQTTAQARTTKDSSTKRVATSSGVSSEAHDNAAREYKARNFSGAGAVLRAAAANTSGGEANDLRALAGTYEQFGKAFNVGMAPGTQAWAEAFDKLRTARNFDRSLGKGYTGEIETRLKEVAPKAAIYWTAKKDFDKALVCVKEAESLGVDPSSPNLQAVRKLIEGEASRLYSEAAAAPPEEAKQKARRILNLIDSKSPTYAKAQKLLSSS